MARILKKLRPTPKKKRRLKSISRYATKGFKGQAPNRQTQILVYNTWRYFRRERLHGGPLFPVEQVGKRVGECLGISQFMVTKYKKKALAGEVLETPGKDRTRVRPIRDVDKFTRDAIRALILELNTKGIHFTLKTLLKKMKDRQIEFEGGVTTLNILLHEMDFFFERRNASIYLKEQQQVAELRFRFLKLFHEFELDGSFSRLYLDETWIFSFGSGVAYIWTNGEWRFSRTKKMPGGSRFIVVHIGGKDGFVEGAELIYNSKTKPKPGDDYHGDMNREIFTKYIKNQVIPNLKEKKVVFMDNASYHKCQVEEHKRPTAKAGKSEKVEWLSRHNRVASEAMTHKVLDKLVKTVDFTPVYEIVELFKEQGHAVVWTPPYHCEYNPIELVWGISKRYFDNHVDGIKTKFPDLKPEDAIKALWKEALSTITPEVWKNCVRKVEDKIREDYKNQVGNFGLSAKPQPLIIRLVDSDGEDEQDVDDPGTPQKSRNDELAVPLSPSITPSRGQKWLVSPNNGKVPPKKTPTVSSPSKLTWVVVDKDTEIGAPLHLPNPRKSPASSKWNVTPSPKKVKRALTFDISKTGTQGTEDIIPLSSEDEDQPVDETLIEGYIRGVNFKDVFALDKDTVVAVRFNMIMRVSHLMALDGCGWLHDEIIMFYLKLIAEHVKRHINIKVHVFDTNLYPNIMAGQFYKVETWTKEVDIFDCDVVLIPVHLGVHWCLCVVEPKAFEITYYDSMAGKNHRGLATVLSYLEKEHSRVRKGIPFHGTLWQRQTRHVSGIGMQPNSYDCGVFLCYYARMVSEGLEITSDIDWLPNMRQQILKGVTECALQELPAREIVNDCHSPEFELYAASQVTLGWQSQLVVGSGFENLAQTCFAAATVQLLFHCPPFLEWLLQDTHHRNVCKKETASQGGVSDNPCISCILGDLLLQSQKCKVLDLSPLVLRIKGFWKEYEYGAQQDAHEFLRKLMEVLQVQYQKGRPHPLKLTQRTSETTPIHAIFGGYVRVSVCCSQCKHESVSYEHLLLLLEFNLDINNAASLPIAFSNEFKTVTIDSYKCIKCHKYVKASKSILVEKLPKVVTIQLIRFMHDGEKINKINKFVRFNPILDLEKHVNPSAKSANVNCKYKLLGVVSHINKSALSGHYTATVQCSDMNFYEFDDHNVKPVNLKKCLDQQAYILMYMQTKK